MSTNFEKGAFAEVDVSGNTTYRIPHAALETIYVGGTTASEGSTLASGSRIKPNYMALANGTTSSGIIFNNDSDHLTITSGGISINTYTSDITSATSAADLKKLPTVSAVKTFVSSYVEQNAGTDVMAGVISPEYNAVTRVFITCEGLGGYYGGRHVYTTFPTEPTEAFSSAIKSSGGSYDGNYSIDQADGTSRGLGGHLCGTVQVYYVDKTQQLTNPPLLYVRVHHTGTVHEHNVTLRTLFPDDLTQSSMIEIPVDVAIPPDCDFEVMLNQGVGQTEYDVRVGSSTEAHSTLYFVPNIGVSVTGTTIQNTIVTDVE